MAFALLLAVAIPVTARAESVTSGPRTLTVSKATGLNPDGDTVNVSGSGYDEAKGIYVALCIVPAAGQIPSPCGGGVNLTGSLGASFWISSNPPSYATNLAIPYGPGGSFSVSLTVGPVIDDAHDCRVIQCAIVTRSDHTRLSDRSQDVLVPISFAAPATATPVITPTTPGSTAVPATATPTATVAPPTDTPAPTATATATPGRAPAAEVSEDGLTSTAGALSLHVSQAEGITPGSTVSVSGSGFTEDKGIYVALCAEPAEGQAPGPCSSGSADVTAWFTSNPPAYANGHARPYEHGGVFGVDLSLDPVIDANTDCRVVACGVATRSDDRAPEDRSQDLYVPVTFSSAPTPDASSEATPGAGARSSSSSGGSNSNWALWAAAAGAVVALGGAVAFMVRRRIAAVVTTVLLVLLLSACGSTSPREQTPAASPTGALPVTVQSADGRTVTVTDTTRIVSLWGNITEVLFDLGLGDNVVGRDITSTVPEEAKALPEVTRAHDVSAEPVLSLNPTLVLGSLDNSGPDTALQQIRNVGVPVILFDDPTSVEDIIPRIQQIAIAVGVPDLGQQMASQTATALASIEKTIPSGTDKPNVAFLYMRGQAGVYLLAGPKSGADSMIAAAGGIDAGTAMGLASPFTPITSEALAEAAPDVILMTTTGLDSVGGVDGLVKIPGIAQTPAGKERRIVTMEDTLLYSFGPRTPDAIAALSHDIYQWSAASP